MPISIFTHVFRTDIIRIQLCHKRITIEKDTLRNQIEERGVLKKCRRLNLGLSVSATWGVSILKTFTMENSERRSDGDCRS